MQALLKCTVIIIPKCGTAATLKSTNIEDRHEYPRKIYVFEALPDRSANGLSGVRRLAYNGLSPTLAVPLL